MWQQCGVQVRGEGLEPSGGSNTILYHGGSEETERQGTAMWGGAPEQGVVSSYQVAHLLDDMAAAARSTRVDVTLGTTELVMSLLQEAGVPVSRNWLLERLKESGHTTSRARLNRALKFCFDLGLAVEGSKGVQWTHTTSPGLLRTLAKGKRV
jgi:hypothetical protein